MANPYYTATGWPGDRALAAASGWRNEYALIQAAFDLLPDASTPNLFTMTDGAGLTGKTATQARAVLQINNVDNTADVNKPISTLTQAALDLKADLASTQAALDLKADLASPALTGNPTAPTQASADNSTKVATTAYVKSLFAGGTGYRYINGTLVQAATAVSTTSTPSITFPVAFPNSVTCVVFSVADLDPGDLRISMAASDLTKVGFIRTGTAAMRINIIAWGY